MNWLKKKLTKKVKKIIKKLVVIISVIAIIGIFNFWFFTPRRLSLRKKEGVKESNQLNFKKIQEKTEDNKKQLIKKSVKLDVPFTSQAPYGYWDDLHNQGCEEAVLIMAKAWLDNEKLTPKKAEKEIIEAVNWQKRNWGGHFDLNAENLVKLAKKHFGIKNIWAEYNISLKEIKEELSKGNLVITPMAGRLLKNSYYRRPGPVYHMVVVIGYDNKKIITNDPGTRRGKNFKYSYSNFFESIHNWPFELGQKEDLSKEEKAIEILKGQKVMIVIEK